jgi:hypothetical protein
VAGFCDIAAVQAHLSKATIGDDTKPSTTQVEGFIDSIASEIKGVLHSKGYATTQDDADAEATLSLINAYGAAALAERAMFPAPKMGEAWKTLWGLYTRGLDRVRKGEIPNLAAQTGGVSIALPRSRYTNNPGSYNDGAFKYGEEQW